MKGFYAISPKGLSVHINGDDGKLRAILPGILEALDKVAAAVEEDDRRETRRVLEEIGFYQENSGGE